MKVVVEVPGLDYVRQLLATNGQNAVAAVGRQRTHDTQGPMTTMLELGIRSTTLHKDGDRGSSPSRMLLIVFRKEQGCDVGLQQPSTALRSSRAALGKVLMDITLSHSLQGDRRWALGGSECRVFLSFPPRFGAASVRMHMALVACAFGACAFPAYDGTTAVRYS